MPSSSSSSSSSSSRSFKQLQIVKKLGAMSLSTPVPVEHAELPDTGLDKTLTISAYEMHHAPVECRCRDGTCSGQGRSCKRTDRHDLHTKNVQKILAHCSEMAILLVGAEEKPLQCHKALLCSYSEFFDGAFYGKFDEAKTGTVKLPEDTVDGMTAFIAWCYTGRIDTHLSGEELWVLGDKLTSTEFSNQAMYLLFDIYYHNRIPAQAAKYAYANTVSPHSLLRCFVADLIVTEGPMMELGSYDLNAKRKTDFIEDWRTIVFEGGQLVQDAIDRDSNFKNEHVVQEWECSVPQRKSQGLHSYEFWSTD